MASETGGSINTGLDSGTPTGTVISAPLFSPTGGTSSATSVSLTADGSNGVCYTLDGTDPVCATGTTCSVGNIYSSALPISSTTTLGKDILPYYWFISGDPYS